MPPQHLPPPPHNHHQSPGHGDYLMRPKLDSGLNVFEEIYLCLSGN